MKRLLAALGAAVAGVAIGLATPTPAAAQDCWTDYECGGDHILRQYNCCTYPAPTYWECSCGMEVASCC
jgi:hypothetical protein